MRMCVKEELERIGREVEGLRRDIRRLTREVSRLRVELALSLKRASEHLEYVREVLGGEAR